MVLSTWDWWIIGAYFARTLLIGLGGAVWLFALLKRSRNLLAAAGVEGDCPPV